MGSQEQMVSECISWCDSFTGESVLVINERFETLKYDLRFLHHLVLNLLFPIGEKKVLLYMFGHLGFVICEPNFKIISIVVKQKDQLQYFHTNPLNIPCTILYNVSYKKAVFNNYCN